MTKIQHGKYDESRHLPDNTGVAQGSGSIVRWHSQICEVLGAEAGQALIEESRQHGISWLLAQLSDTGHDDLVEAYKQLRRDDAAMLRIKEHERVLRRCQEQLATETNAARRNSLEKQIQKAQRYLAKHS